MLCVVCPQVIQKDLQDCEAHIIALETLVSSSQSNRSQYERLCAEWKQLHTAVKVRKDRVLNGVFIFFFFAYKRYINMTVWWVKVLTSSPHPLLWPLLCLSGHVLVLRPAAELLLCSVTLDWINRALRENPTSLALRSSTIFGFRMDSFFLSMLSLLFLMFFFQCLQEERWALKPIRHSGQTI